MLREQSSQAVGANDPTTGGPVRVATRAGPFLAERSDCSRPLYYKGAKRAIARYWLRSRGPIVTCGRRSIIASCGGSLAVGIMLVTGFVLLQIFGRR